MDFRNILLLVASVLDFVLAFFVFKNNRKRELNVAYALLATFSGLWSLGIALFRASTDYSSQLFWNQEFILAAGLIASSFLHFTFVFSDKEIRLKNWQRFLIYVPNVLVLIGVATAGVMIKGIRIRSWGNESVLGWGYAHYAFYFGAFWIWGTLNLVKKLLHATGIFKNQLIYILAGLSVSIFFGVTFNLLLILFGDYRWIWLGPYASFIFLLITTYTIVRYRLMDIRVVAKRFFVYIGLAIWVYVSFYVVAWIMEKFFGGLSSASGYMAGAILAPAFVLLFNSTNRVLHSVANKYFFVSLYNYQETIAKLTDKLTSSIDLGKIVNLIVGTVKDVMKLDRAGILLISRGDGAMKCKIAKVIGFEESDGKCLVRDNFLVSYLEKTQKPLVRDEIQMLGKRSSGERDRGQLAELSQNMKKIDASLCLPMVISNRLVGIIVLGDKISGDAYTSDDLDLLNTLSKQASIAVENARLYKEVRDFNKTLGRTVNEQTKEIREQKEQVEKLLAKETKAHALEKRANAELRKLDESKTDFMLITQHHLRTPLSTNAGIIDLMISGAYGKPTKKMKEAMVKLQDSNAKGIGVINELLDVSSYQIGKEAIRLDEKIDFSALMEETLKDLRTEAKKKNIYLKYDVEGKIPKIPADRTKLKMVLTNVIDNCIKYTTKGGVVVTAKADKDNLMIAVADTGIGMSDDVKEGLFKRTFNRGEEAQKMFALGKGLGLFLSGKIIEGHHGKIWAESRGVGKGSVFYVELPLKQEAARGRTAAAKRDAPESGQA